MTKTVGISEMAIGTRPDDVLVTYSLGSCVGVTLFDPLARVGGMVHCMLPFSSLNPEKAQQAPAMFVDTGIPLLIQKLVERGARTTRMVAKAAGAASPLADPGMFRIGERNVTTLRSVLSAHGLSLRGEALGGTEARTLYLYLDQGSTVIKSRGKEVAL